MKRLVISIAFMFVLTAAASTYAAEVASDSTADIQQVLNRLRGSSGLYGANASEMNQFIDMVDPQVLAEITERLRVQLEEQGGTENMSLEEVSLFVSQNLTRTDASLLLGTSVSSEDFQRGVQAGRNTDNLDMLVQMLGGK